MSFGVKICEVEFVGGPLDGYHRAMPLDPMTLTPLIAVPINVNMLAAASGQRRGQKRPASSVAIYDRQISDGDVCYQFLGSSTTAEFRLEDWRG